MEATTLVSRVQFIVSFFSWFKLRCLFVHTIVFCRWILIMICSSESQNNCLFLHTHMNFYCDVLWMLRIVSVCTRFFPTSNDWFICYLLIAVDLFILNVICKSLAYLEYSDYWTDLFCVCIFLFLTKQQQETCRRMKSVFNFSLCLHFSDGHVTLLLCDSTHTRYANQKKNARNFLFQEFGLFVPSTFHSIVESQLVIHIGWR